MKELLERFIFLERNLAEQRGPFALFALFLREDAQDRWDLIVAAPWIETDRRSALTLLTNQIQKSLRPEELTQLSRVVLVDENNPALEAINSAVHVEHGAADVQDGDFFGLHIRRAFIITSQRLDLKTPALV